MPSGGKPKRKLPDIEIGSKILDKDAGPKEARSSLVDLTLSFNPYPAKPKATKKRIEKR